jgi:hypothetical protein
MRPTPLALGLVLVACAHHAAPARHVVTPAHDTPWRLEVTALGGSLDELDEAIAQSFAANPQLTRVEGAGADGRVTISMSTTGGAVVAETCSADVHVVVYRGDETQPIDDRTQQLTESCGIHGHGMEALYAQSAAWAIEHALERLAQP